MLAYFSLEFFGVVSLFLLFVFHFVNIYTFIIPVCFIFAGQSGLTAIGMGEAAGEVKDKANVTAMINFLIIALPVISTYISGHLSTQSPIKLPSVYLIIIALLGILGMILYRMKLLNPKS